MLALARLEALDNGGSDNGVGRSKSSPPFKASSKPVNTTKKGETSADFFKVSLSYTLG